MERKMKNVKKYKIREDNMLLIEKTKLSDLSPVQKKNYLMVLFCLPLPFVILMLIPSLLFLAATDMSLMIFLMLSSVLFVAGFWIFSVACVRLSEFIQKNEQQKFTWKNLKTVLCTCDRFRDRRWLKQLKWDGIYFAELIIIYLGTALLSQVLISNLDGINPSLAFLFWILLIAFIPFSFTEIMPVIIIPFCTVPFMKRQFTGIINLSVKAEDECSSIAYPHFYGISLVISFFTQITMFLSRLNIFSFESAAAAYAVSFLCQAAAWYVNMVWCERVVFSGIRSLKNRNEKKGRIPSDGSSYIPENPKTR